MYVAVSDEVQLTSAVNGIPKNGGSDKTDTVKPSVHLCSVSDQGECGGLKLNPELLH